MLAPDRLSIHGQVIWKCTVPGTVAFTFDDGPWFHTEYILNELAQRNARATFFLTGVAVSINQTQESYWAPIVQRMYNEGHLVGLHTWSHTSRLESLGRAERQDEYQRISDFLAKPNFLNGLRPMYRRAPYGYCTAETGCIDDLTRGGHRLIFWTLDSMDWMYNGQLEYRQTLEIMGDEQRRIDPKTDSSLILMHDDRVSTGIHIGRIMDGFIERGFKLVTVGECINDDKANWYKMSGQLPTMASLTRADALRIVSQWHDLWAMLMLGALAASALMWAVRRSRRIRGRVFFYTSQHAANA